jgi:hypothetical protein
MKFIAIVYCLFILILAGGCSQKTVPSVQNEKNDSSYVRVIESSSDTDLTSIPDSACIDEISLTVDSSSNIIDVPVTTVKSKTASIEFKVKDNKLSVKCNCDSVTLKCRKYQKSTYYYKGLYEKQKTIITPPPVQYTPLYMRILAWIGGMTVLIIVGGIGYHINGFRILISHLKNK